ncbi:MAG TPA: PQQ-binding-like beta-propeller repeat protein, partial [Candidatus Dormibacteraeota bacterium]|nr:PQQ-binding-like beta-propeller repeat protein [Candidatus Dormibacteraeota bacterium]
PMWGLALDGSTFAQPLVVHGLLLEATEHDTVYAFDAASGCLAWRTALGTPFDVTRHRLECNNIKPELGITATPAADPTTGTVYVVAFFDPGRYEMDALDLASGVVRWRHPISLPDSDVLQQLSRPAVALANGRAYASFGGRAGDCGTYHGFVVGVSEDGQGPDVTFQAGSGPKAAIWAPGGPVVLPGGDLLVATGNSDELHQFDGSNSVDRLSPDLQRKDFFAAPNWAYLNRVDFDLGSVGPTVVDGGLVFQVGKDGTGYLLDADHLGGVGGQRYSAKLTGGCYAIGATAYAPPLIYVPCDHSLTVVRVSGSRFDVRWRGPDFRSGSPIVAGGLVWDYDFEGGVVWGFDAASGAVRQRLQVGIGEHFVAPSSSQGRLYVPVRNRLYAFSF